jgi:hypothetical protein
MKIVIFIVLAVLLGGGAAIAMFPMSVAADFAAKQVPELHYAGASGSVWDGKLTGVSMGDQSIGDLSVKADAVALVGGKASGKLALGRAGFTGESGVTWPLAGGPLEFEDLKLAGKAGLVPGMPQAVALAGGDFSLEIKHLKFAGDVCESASGEVWTDALTRVNVRGWVGPELRGPVTCRDGKLVVEANGRSQTGEDVRAQLNISHRLDMELTATVLNAQGTAAEALSDIGFKPEGNALVMRQALGS